MKWINVKDYAREILDEVKAIPDKSRALVILHAGDDPASASYMRGKIRDCQYCGIEVMPYKVQDMEELMDRIDEANRSDWVGGIIVQLPLPEGWDADAVTQRIRPDKDVDGFRPDSPFKPCTPEGIVWLMKKELGEDLAGQDVVLVGKGRLVGKPLIPMLLDEGCTLTVCHSRSSDPNEVISRVQPEVVISAVGKPGLVDLFSCRNCNLVIDAGITREDGHLAGDCIHFDDKYEPWIHVTPVPGGVGLLTRAMLMKHMGEVQ